MESAGSRLKKIRQEKGISLEEAHKKTKIHLNILKAMEGDGLTDLSPVYLKGFLKIYCKFLVVDPKDYVPDYKETQTQFSNITTNKNLIGKPIQPPTFLETASLKLIFLRENVGRFRKAFIFILIAVLLSLALFNLGKFVASKLKARPQGGFQKIRTMVVASTVQPKETKSQPKTGAAKQTQTNAEGTSVKKKEIPPAIRLGIRARENCWASVKTDGKLVFQSVLEKGRSKFWNAREKIELSLGNAGAVELEVNGQIFSNLGKRGQARKNILVTKEGLNIGR
jgi:cytoskeleton protein RodZ